MQQFVGFLQDTAYFLVSFVRGTYRSVRDNKGLAAFSIVLAFGIWMVVIEADNPTSTSVVPYDLVLEPVNVPSSLAVVEPIGGPDLHVRVRVAANDDTFGDLTAANFQATIDLSGFAVGEYKVPVKVQPVGPGSGGVRVEAVLPEEITVTLAELKGKEVPVIPAITGNLVPGYTMSAPDLEDTSVIVSGPQSEVDKVTSVSAAINVEGVSDDIDQAVRLIARDARGTLIPGVQIDPPLINVQISIEQQKFSRSMAVSAAITDSPADGYNIASVSVTPGTVTVRGSESFITGTASISTKPISVAGETDTVVKTVSLDLPTGAEVTGGVPVVTVTIRIVPSIGEYNFTIPVIVRNLGNTLAVQGALPSVTVTLRGPLPDLQAIGANDIAATVNLDGRDAGALSVPVEVTTPTGITVTSVSPSDINITLVGR